MVGPEANGIGVMVTERIGNGHKLTSFFFFFKGQNIYLVKMPLDIMSGFYF